jgi:malate dehydrogenase (oxaloacetate-decarboxylating)
MSYDNKALAAHKRHQGKIEIRSRFPLRNKEDLSIAYTPGVAAVSRAIAKDKRLVKTHTLAGRTIAVVTDGSAILGLGNLGPEAALPVMEGKAALFKSFAGLDAFPIALATNDVDAIVQTVKAIAPTFGGINLEDIAAPRCFAIEERLKAELDIPVMHDDQHGTAIVVLAALINAMKLTKRNPKTIKVVISGAGAAAVATYRLLVHYGIDPQRIIMLDSKGALSSARTEIDGVKRDIALESNGEGYSGGLDGALVGADVFIGVSKADVLNPEWIERMADRPIVFAMANPDPEISFHKAKKTKIAVLGTGRSDYPNQINNVLAFPGVFRGAIDAKATAITEEMKLAAAKAIAKLVPSSKLSTEYVIPNPFDKRVAPAVARAVMAAWRNCK